MVTHGSLEHQVDKFDVHIQISERCVHVGECCNLSLCVRVCDM